MDNRETLTHQVAITNIKRHLFSEVARKELDKGSGVGEGAFVCRPNRQSFGFRVAASSGPILKAPGSAGGYYFAGTERFAWPSKRSTKGANGPTREAIQNQTLGDLSR